MVNAPSNLFYTLDIGEKWPSGDFKEIAIIDISPEVLGQKAGMALCEGDEVGLGRWQSIGGKLRSGAVIELISYDASLPRGFILRVDVGSDMARALQDTLMALGVGAESVLWTASLGAHG